MDFSRKMTVGELISELQKFDESKTVFIDDEYTGDKTTISQIARIGNSIDTNIRDHIYLVPTDVPLLETERNVKVL